MTSSNLLQFCIVLLLATVAQAALDFSFQITHGGNENYFFRDNLTSAQVLLTSANSSSSLKRLVIAMPASNSGALTYFLPLDNSTSGSDFTVTLQNNTLESTTDDFDNVGVQANLNFTGNATLGVTIVGAVRTTYESGAQLNVTPGNNGTYTPPTVNILVDETGFGILQMRFFTNETSLTGLSPPDFFLPEGSGNGSALDTALTGLANGTNQIAQQVSFLTYEDTFLAGGWRFLTYFGRDSMIALRLLMPTLTPEATEASIGSVIERANTTGALCHEETVGDYASFVNIGNNRSDLGNQPFHDYKMIDTDLFLLPTLEHFFLDLPQGLGRASSFLERNATLQNGTYGQLLNKTIFYNLGRAIPFAQNSTVSNLLAFRPGQLVGNRCDSNEGTGFGRIPFDVNTALVPASLRATARLARAGIIGNSVSNVTLDNGTAYDANSTLADVADSIAAVWEERALPFFEVTLEGASAEARLQNFVNQANLSEALLNDTINATEASNKTFYALSLMEDGSPVEVLHSDLGFNLLYGNNVSQELLQGVVEALQPYPRGLLTNVGMVIANPAYDSNTTNIEVLNNAAYHGTVIWSWQQGIMAAGLQRQLGYCTNSSNVTVDTNPSPDATPTWCSNSMFVQNVSDAQSRLWTSIKGAIDYVFSEVWTYSFDNSTNTFSVGDISILSAAGTESDAIQLWSYGFLGLLDLDGERVGQ
ncbi:hypothetical protein ACEPAG_9275 [Sanghuangporus baumii]